MQAPKIIPTQFWKKRNNPVPSAEHVVSSLPSVYFTLATWAVNEWAHSDDPYNNWLPTGALLEQPVAPTSSKKQQIMK